jgi:hypothetical protein
VARQQNPFARSEDLVLDDMRALRRKTVKSPAPRPTPQRDLRRKPRNRLEQFFFENDIRQADLV